MSDVRLARAGRRGFLARASALGGAALLGVSRSATAEPPPEIRRIRLIDTPAICRAPEYLAEALLRGEGFTDVEFVKLERGSGPELLAEGRVDMTMWDVPGTIPTLDAGRPVAVLGGVHAGCYELFASDRIRTLRDLKGKTIAVSALQGGDHLLISSILAYAGMDPRTDVRWVAGSNYEDPMRLFIDGKVEAFIGFAPQPQALRAKKIGHVLVNTTQDRPWSQYFCCVVLAGREFATRYPVATKRALRAFLKASDICAQQPERVARYLVQKGFEPDYNIGLEVLKSLPFNRWRDADCEDTIRFYALRLHEVGMIKTAPNQLIAQGTNWRFVNELKRELKG